MNIPPFKAFYKASQRITHLYEVSLHSYGLLYDEGRERLRQNPDGKYPLNVEGKTIVHPLKNITFHARDIYPNLLRSTLLISLVAAYEAFLIDTIEFVCSLSRQVLRSDKRIDISQEQFLAIAQHGQAEKFLLDMTLRKLTSGGLEEIRKFYQRSLGFDILATGQKLEAIQELHDRRHLFVHRAGYVDRQYQDRYPASGFEEGDRIIIGDSYLREGISTLLASALAIKHACEAGYPGPTAATKKYAHGDVILPEMPERIHVFSIIPLSDAARTELTNLDTEVFPGLKLRSILVWLSESEERITYMVACSSKELLEFSRFIHNGALGGKLKRGESFKIKKQKP